MYILGLGGSLHDFSACLCKDNEIIVAIEEERITRQKHAVDKDALQEAIVKGQIWKYLKNVPENTLEKSVQYCLQHAGISLTDIDLVITTDSNLHIPYVKSFAHLLVMNHHLAHAASAYYPSEFDEAAILVVDGRGSQVLWDGELGYESTTFAYGSGNRINILSKGLEHSVGHFYEAVTLGLGFGILEDGKTMGLSSYGTDTYVSKMAKFYTLEDDGLIKFLYECTDIQKFVENEVNEEYTRDDLFQIKADLAFAAQRHLENMMCHYANHLYKITSSKNLCIAGGVGLNSVANGIIYNNTPFENIFIQPAAGDNGLAIGAALYGNSYLNFKKL